MKNITLEPIGHVISRRTTDEDSNWAEFPCHVQLDENRFSADSLKGLESFSHAIIVFYLDQTPAEMIRHHARHPRNNPQWPEVGIFAQRTSHRPNLIGVTVSRILKVEGIQLHLEALDAMNGTPVLDIKPCTREFGPQGELIQPAWMAELMQGYWRV